MNRISVKFCRDLKKYLPYGLQNALVCENKNLIAFQLLFFHNNKKKTFQFFLFSKYFYFNGLHGKLLGILEVSFDKRDIKNVITHPRVI